jgi:enoyl-CoA hydratase
MTGRPIEAEEALMMGLANRVAPKGEGLAAAILVAEQIAAFPQTCMRNDRQSAYEQWDLSFEEAMHREFELGRASLAAPELKGGLKNFASGKGRGGSFD